MKKCYLTEKEVSEKELAEVFEILAEEENYDKVVGFYNLIRLEKEGDEFYTEEGEVVLSLEKVREALK